MNNIVKFLNNWSVPIIILSLPLYLLRFNIFGIPSTLLEILFLIFFVAWFLENYKGIKTRIKIKISDRLSQSSEQKKHLRNYPFSIFIILFVLSSFFALAVTGFSTPALGVYKAYFIEAVLFFILAFNYFKKEENRERVFFALAISAFSLSLFALYQKFNGLYWDGGVLENRVTSIFPYPNALGLYLGPIATFLYFVIISKAKKLISNFQFPISNKLSSSNFQYSKNNVHFLIWGFYCLTFFISLYSIYLAKSEAGLAAVLISIFVGSIFISKRFAITSIVFLFIASGLILGNDNLRSFALEKIQLKDFSGEVRKQQWRETAEMLKNKNRFLLGCGLSGYQECVDPYHQEGIFFNESRDPDFRRKIVIFDDEYRAKHWRPVEIYMYPHNFFLNFWVELGLLGLVAVLGLIIQFFFFGVQIIRNSKLEIRNSSVQSKRILIIGLMAVMVEIILHGTLDVPYFKNDLSFLFWIFVAITGVYWVEHGELHSK